MDSASSERTSDIPLRRRSFIGDTKGLYALYQRLRETPRFWDDRYKDDPFLFANMILASNTVVLEVGDAAGVIYFAGITPGFSAVANIAIWDPAYLGRPDIGVAACHAIMTGYDLQRLDAWIMEKNNAAIRYAEAVGFKLEGIIRRQVWYNGGWENLALLGLLREELNGRSLQRPGIETPANSA